MASDFGLKLRIKLEELPLPKQAWNNEWPLPIVGCNPQQVAAAKRWQGVKRLPALYEQFLLAMGESPGDLFIGFDLSLHWLENFKNDANECLRENGLPTQLPEDAFVFMSQQGHTYWYFLTNNDADDPPVYRYSDDDGEPDNPYKNGPVKEWEHFSELITLFIAERAGAEAQKNFLLETL
jgi:hypothetical protein